MRTDFSRSHDDPGGANSTEGRAGARTFSYFSCCVVAFWLLIASVAGAALGFVACLWALNDDSRYHQDEVLHEKGSNEGLVHVSSSSSSSLWDDGHVDQVCDLSNVIIAIESGSSSSKYRDRRNLWRNSQCAESYKANNMNYKFMMGLPSSQILDPRSHNQGRSDSPEEIRALASLRDEQDEFKDMVILPTRDIYDDLMVKTFQILQWTTQHDEDSGALLVLHDDEYCADLDHLQSLCRSAKDAGVNLYGGFYLFEDPEGSYSPYFAGGLYVLSRPLVNSMVTNNALLTGSHLTTSEDMRVGYWVERQVKEEENSTIEQVLMGHDPELLVEAKAKDAIVDVMEIAAKVTASPAVEACASDSVVDDEEPTKRPILRSARKRQLKPKSGGGKGGKGGKGSSTTTTTTLSAGGTTTTSTAGKGGGKGGKKSKKSGKGGETTTTTSVTTSSTSTTTTTTTPSPVTTTTTTTPPPVTTTTTTTTSPVTTTTTTTPPPVTTTTTTLLPATTTTTTTPSPVTTTTTTTPPPVTTTTTTPPPVTTTTTTTPSPVTTTTTTTSPPATTTTTTPSPVTTTTTTTSSPVTTTTTTPLPVTTTTTTTPSPVTTTTTTTPSPVTTTTTTPSPVTTTTTTAPPADPTTTTTPSPVTTTTTTAPPADPTTTTPPPEPTTTTPPPEPTTTANSMSMRRRLVSAVDAMVFGSSSDSDPQEIVLMKPVELKYSSRIISRPKDRKAAKGGQLLGEQQAVVNRLGAPGEENLVVSVSCGSHYGSSCEACPRGNGRSWCNGDCQWNFLLDICEPRQPVVCGAHKASSCQECSQGHGESWCHGECAWNHNTTSCEPKTTSLHPAYKGLMEMGAFQPVQDENGEYVNILFVRRMFVNEEEEALYHKFKNEILFLGIMSYETFPFPSPNPRSFQFPQDKYLDMFPGWLNMYRNSQDMFPSNVKVLDMSQSDFTLPEIDFEKEVDNGQHIKRFDFGYAMSDLNITADAQCDSWGAFAKNWSFVRDSALDVLCGDLGLTGVLLVTKDEESDAACAIPPSCKGKVVQTPFLPQSEFHAYMRQSRFWFLPQVYDASPRVAAQALTMNIPLLMNKNIVGGWKYLNEKTGEFFNDESDFRESVERIMSNLDTYEPRKHMLENYGSEMAGKKLRTFVEENFGDRVNLPPGKLLIPIFN